VSNRWLRFVIALLALTAAAAAAFKIFDQEQRFVANSTTLGAAARAAESATTTATEIKAALHAYVAAGQGQPFWTSRARTLLDALRDAVLELDGLGSTLGLEPTDALDLSDRLAASEQRARDYVQAAQPLLASDVIFTDSRDLLEGVRMQIARARDGIVGRLEAQQSEIRREQATLALAAGGILALGVLILVPTGRLNDPEADLSGLIAQTSTSAPANSPELRRDLADRSADDTDAAFSRESGPQVRVAPWARPAEAAAPVAPAAHAAPAEPAEPAPMAPAEPPAPVPLTAAASLCTDLARVSDSSEITGLLRRACDVLGASGIILWIASPDRRMLVPVASAGYDERLVNRIGPIARDEPNLTAIAFREAASQSSGSADTARAALAVPLVTPEGAVGVFSAELQGGDSLEPRQVDLATIVAAQLSMIVGALPVETAAAAAHHAQA
jgi:hypothetical protein